jgi:cell division protease FtsH
MSALGPIQYESNNSSVFLGRDYNSTQKNFSTQIAFEIDTEVRKIIEDAHSTAKKIIQEKKDDLILIAETLLKKETITSEEIETLLKNRSLDGVEKTVSEEKPVKTKKVKKETTDA